MFFESSHFVAPYHSDIFIDGVSQSDRSRFRKSILRGGTDHWDPPALGDRPLEPYAQRCFWIEHEVPGNFMLRL